MAIGIKDKVQFNVTGRTLSFEAPQGRPSADGTVALYDPRYRQDDAVHNPIGASGTATRRAISTTLTAAAGASQTNPKNVPVVPPAPLAVGDYVLLTNDSGQVERGEIVAKAAATVTLRDPLEYDYATGATFESAVMDSPAIDATWLSVITNIVEDCYAIWTYAVAGKTYRVRTYFDVVREIASWTIPDSLLYERYPDLRRWKFEDRVTFEGLKQAAIRDVDATIVEVGRDPDRCRGSETMARLVELRFWVIAAENGFHPIGREIADFLDERDRAWAADRNSVLNGTLKVPYDVNHDDVIEQSERRTTHRRLRR